MPIWPFSQCNAKFPPVKINFLASNQIFYVKSRSTDRNKFKIEFT